MKISVITVARNAEKTIGYTIESFLRQTYPDKELVLVDGLSTDGTLKLAESFNSPLISIRSEKDAGVYDAMNKGLQRFTGDAFGFLNADDAFHADTSMERIAQALAQADIATGHVSFVNDHVERKQVRLWKSTPFASGSFQRGWIVPHPGLYCRKAVFDRVGLFDPTYKIGGDYDWIIRAFEVEKFSSAVVDEIVVDMAVGGVSTSGLKAYLINAQETTRARKRWLGPKGAYTALLWNAVRKIAQVRV